MRVSTSYASPQRVERFHPHAHDTDRLSTSIRSPAKFTPMGDELLRAKVQNGITPFAKSGIAQGVATATPDATPLRDHAGVARCAITQSLKNSSLWVMSAKVENHRMATWRCCRVVYGSGVHHAHRSGTRNSRSPTSGCLCLVVRVTRVSVPRRTVRCLLVARRPGTPRNHVDEDST